MPARRFNAELGGGGALHRARAGRGRARRVAGRGRQRGLQRGQALAHRGRLGLRGLALQLHMGLGWGDGAAAFIGMSWSTGHAESCGTSACCWLEAERWVSKRLALAPVRFPLDACIHGCTVALRGL